MTPLNRQNAFNTAYNGVIAQGKPSVIIFENEKLPICAYRSNDGCKCNVGHLIPDDKYDPRMENLSFNVLNRDFPLFDDKDSRFLREMQQAHDIIFYNTSMHEKDNCVFIENYKKAMKSFAGRYGLRCV